MDITDHRIPFYPLERQLCSVGDTIARLFKRRSFRARDPRKILLSPLSPVPETSLNRLTAFYPASIGFLKRVERLARRLPVSPFAG